tara:strand:+ start:158 stop:664 length:507 start_codon:yes stop_codon:yes gene_type:complete
MENVLITENRDGKLFEKKDFKYKNKSTGEVIEDSNYKFMLTQDVDVYNNGYINTATRVAFVPVSQKSFDSWRKRGLVQDGAIFPFNGKIVVKETLEPYVNKTTGQIQEPKKRGINGSVCYHFGEPIYRNSVFTMDMDEEDVFLKMDAAKAEMVADEPANDTDVDESAI